MFYAFGVLIVLALVVGAICEAFVDGVSRIFGAWQ